MLWALLLAASARAFDNGFLKFDDPPPGWTVKELGCFEARCRVDAYLDSQWFEAAPKTKGWAHVQIEYFPLTGQDPPDLCRSTPVIDLPAARRELDCETPLVKSCPRPRNKVPRYPRAPIGGHCGRYVGMTPAFGGKGFLYDIVFDPEDKRDLGDHPYFNHALVQKTLLFGRPNDKRLFRVDVTYPRDETELAERVFKKILGSLLIGTRHKPGKEPKRVPGSDEPDPSAPSKTGLQGRDLDFQPR